MRLLPAALLLTAVACSGDDDALTPLDRLPPAVALAGNVRIDSQLVARVEAPVSTLADGTVRIRVTVTNAGSEPVVGGVCADRVDARPVGITTWYDVTAANATCTRQAQAIAPGTSGTLTGIADRDKMRAVSRDRQITLFVRVRKVFAAEGSGTQVGMQSAELPVYVP